jgi:hypothetical protein
MIFTDHAVRDALKRKGFDNPSWNGCAARSDVKTVLTELRTGQQFTGTHHETFPMRREQAEAVNKTFAYFHSIWAGGCRGRPALPVEREDALRQDLHHLPARQKARGQARAGGDLQARRRGCLADRPGIPCGLRRLAIPLAQLGGDPSQIDRASRSSISARSRTCWAATAGNIKPRTNGCTVNWDLVVFDEYHFGAWRETARSCSRARRRRSPRRRPSSNTPPGWTM